MGIVPFFVKLISPEVFWRGLTGSVLQCHYLLLSDLWLVSLKISGWVFGDVGLRQWLWCLVSWWWYDVRHLEVSRIVRLEIRLKFEIFELNTNIKIWNFVYIIVKSSLFTLATFFLLNFHRPTSVLATKIPFQVLLLFQRTFVFHSYYGPLRRLIRVLWSLQHHFAPQRTFKSLDRFFIYSLVNFIMSFFSATCLQVLGLHLYL